MYLEIDALLVFQLSEVRHGSLALLLPTFRNKQDICLFFWCTRTLTSVGSLISNDSNDSNESKFVSPLDIFVKSYVTHCRLEFNFVAFNANHRICNLRSLFFFFCEP